MNDVEATIIWPIYVGMKTELIPWGANNNLGSANG
jgi:hypothetical protein